MFNQNYPQYIKTEDGNSLYVCTNFDPQKSDEERVVVFNYGLICNNSHWEKQIAHFDHQGIKVLAHDYRGHFNSQGIDRIEKITFFTLVSDLHTICKQLNIKNTIMFGHSMGVNITLEFAKQFPQKIVAQVLISGTVFPPHDIMFNSKKMNFFFPIINLFQKALPEIYQYIWQNGGLNPLVAYLIHKGGFHIRETSREFVQIYLNRIGKLSPKLFLHLIEEMKAHDIIDYLEGITTPTLIIGGDEDKVIPFSMQRVMHAKLPNAELYMAKDGSHVPQIDFPDSINQRIDLFLQKL